MGYIGSFKKRYVGPFKSVYSPFKDVCRALKGYIVPLKGYIISVKERCASVSLCLCVSRSLDFLVSVSGWFVSYFQVVGKSFREVSLDGFNLYGVYRAL